VPRMSTVGAECLAAALRSIGFDAEVSPPSNDETLALAARFTTGEECLPQRVVLGNFLRVMRRDDFDPAHTAFFLPTSSGPCRFGQYAPFMRKILKELSHEDALVFSPTSSDGYEGIARDVTRFKRTAWRAVIASDILRKIHLMRRPYEAVPGDADRILGEGIREAAAVLEDRTLRPRRQLRRLAGALEGVRDAFLDMSLKEAPGSRPLIGIVGEIFLRLNSFSNQELVRRVEARGGECWMADVGEWIWYTNVEQQRKLRDAGRRFGGEMAGAKIREAIQHADEEALLKPFRSLFSGREEMSVREVLKRSAPYLPQRKALGEMTLNAGKAIAFYEAGCDGVIDISPFTCMNGIVTEVFYPAISRDHDGIPIRIFYFDGASIDLDRDVDMFMELVVSYRERRLVKSPKGS